MAVCWGDGQEVEYRTRFAWLPVYLWDWHLTAGKMWVRMSRKKAWLRTVDEMKRYDGEWLAFDPAHPST
jgi:hypothetical protein